MTLWNEFKKTSLEILQINNVLYEHDPKAKTKTDYLI